MQSFTLTGIELFELMTRNGGDALVRDDIAFIVLDGVLHILVDDFKDITTEELNERIMKHFA